MSNLIDVLKDESNISLEWLKNNDIIANPEKFHALLIGGDKSDASGVDICIQGKNTKSEDSVKLLGIKLDNKLNFDSHISFLCHNAATQLNVLKRLKSFIGFEERKVLIVIRVLVAVRWFGIFHQQSPCKKLKRYKLRLLYSNLSSSYDALPVQSGRCYMRVSRRNLQDYEDLTALIA